jgi:hypothetical protein
MCRYRGIEGRSTGSEVRCLWPVKAHCKAAVLNLKDSLKGKRIGIIIIIIIISGGKFDLERLCSLVAA